MGTNPKHLAAVREGRVPLDLLEPAADEQIARALEVGAGKYGRQDFLVNPIEARTYVAAMRRHLADWLKGEDNDPETGINHIGHVGASVHIILAAIAKGTFIDNRAPEEVAS